MQTVIGRFFTLQLLTAILLADPVFAARSINANFSEPFVDEGVGVTASDIQRYLKPRKPESTAIDIDVLKFYSDRHFKPVWIGNGVNDEMAASVEAALEHADEQGLRQADYDAFLVHWKKQSAPGAERDVALTRALFHYAKDVRLGRLRPDQVYRDIRLPSLYFDTGPPLADALAHQTIDAFLSDLPPPQPEYLGLVSALARYREVAQEGGWPIIPGSSKIVPGSKDPRIALLVRRLEAEDPDFVATPDLSGSDLADTIKQYQQRNGLPADGIAGLDTLSALNVSVATRIRQIIANMERWRWMPRDFEASYIRVNVPDQSVDFVKDGEVVLHSKVIVGTKQTPTPILRTEVKAVVVNPPWDIPGDLAAKKILPRLQADPDYLKTRDMTIVDGPADDPYGTKIDWHNVNAATMPAVQQAPGSDNALGTVMLDMPNDFDVYLHDTPNKEKFKQDTREFSNGCVRVEQILSLASYVLTGTGEEGLDKLHSDIASHNTRSLDLEEPVPVYLEYWTAVGNADGTVGFRPDRYGRDTPLLARLTAPPPPALMKPTDVAQSR